MSVEVPNGALPHTDSKKVGAGDFYFAINATFRFIEKQFGRDGLLRYWQDLGANFYVLCTGDCGLETRRLAGGR